MTTLTRTLAVVALGLLLPAFADAGTLAIQSVSPGNSVKPGTQLSFVMNPQGFGSTLTYSIADSFSGTTITNANFNSSGVFTWIPQPKDSGIHNLTVTGVDQTGNYNIAYLQVTVEGDPNVTLETIIPGATVRVGQTLSFTARAFNFTSPTFTAVDPFAATTMTAFAINSNGSFSWTPQSADIGVHPLVITAQDSTGKFATITQNIVVQPAAFLTLDSQSATAVYPAQPVTIKVSPTGFVAPSYALTDSKVGSTLHGGLMSSSGILVWTPGLSDVGQHNITISATDYSGKLASITVGVTVLNQVIVQPPIPPIVTPPPSSNNYKFYYSLDVGSRGNDVGELQLRLAREGVYIGPVTGYFGVLTQAGVRAYQAKYGIDVVGRVGPMTRARLNQ